MRIFSIGLGTGADPGLIKGMAHATLGNYTLISDNDDLSQHVIKMLSSSLSPALSNVSISAPDLTMSWPSPFPPLFANSPQRFIVKASKTDRILISGDCGGENVEELVNVMQIPDDIGTKQLFAKSAIADIENKLILKPNDEEKQRCIKLSIETGIICKFTSYISVDFESKEEREKYSSDPDCAPMNALFVSSHKSLFEDDIMYCIKRFKTSHKSLFASDDYDMPPEQDVKHCDKRNDTTHKSLFASDDCYVPPEQNVKRCAKNKRNAHASKYKSDQEIDDKINCQNVDGSWDHFTGIDRNIEMAYGKVAAATFAAIIYIIKKYGSSGKYSLIIKKATNYLKSNFKDIDWDILISNGLKN